MKLIVGLGNPGAKYQGNRHNIGFMALDRIAADHGFSPWRARFQGEISEGRLGGERVTLLKPATFMNLSGQSVGEAMRYLKLEPGDVIVLHDELDLARGQRRLVPRRLAPVLFAGAGVRPVLRAAPQGIEALAQTSPSEFRKRLALGAFALTHRWWI